MTELTFTLESWSAWAPNIDAAEQWQQWAHNNRAIELEGSPQLPFVAPMLRRRMSRLSKMAIHCLHQCNGDELALASIFSSRHGEVGRTIALLEDIVQQQPPSPTAFSLSVHNTASGLYHISTKNHQASTALAAGKDSFEAGIIEAAGQLHENPQQPVLLVVYDEPLPESLADFADEAQFAYALALKLSLQAETTDNNNPSLRLNIAPPPSTNTTATAVTSNLPHALRFLRFLLTDEPQLITHGQHQSWEWYRA